ncbi:hypothetical protein [Pacificibacter maritimus]|uniref:hypothetical protein n=1 Tax=Pacificibacter maritimus TaxID=762213 RepID=UPI000F502483|nr:hypothetical protein [Pacificibacter maritimus]
MLFLNDPTASFREGAKVGHFSPRLPRYQSCPQSAPLFRLFGHIDSVDLTDRLCVELTNGDVLHLRASGNAPEFHIYAQSGSEGRAWQIVAQTKQAVATTLS